MTKSSEKPSNGKSTIGIFSFFEKIPPVARFVVTFLILLVLISIGFSQLFTRYHDNMLWLMESTAAVCGASLAVFSDSAGYDDVYVRHDGFTVEIIDECTGLFEMLIYLAAVISFPTTVRKKLVGIAVGIPAVYVFNILRIMILLIVGAVSKSFFEFMHLYLWQVTLIIMISVIWIGWLYMVVYREKRDLAISD
jgi:exosortase H (IPTLxxWG-CTERM-specific)